MVVSALPSVFVPVSSQTGAIVKQYIFRICSGRVHRPLCVADSTRF